MQNARNETGRSRFSFCILHFAFCIRIYWSIALPLARPILATLATFMFMSTWNDFMWPLIIQCQG
jgi:ABC-type maltose transport system permease subunit